MRELEGLKSCLLLRKIPSASISIDLYALINKMWLPLDLSVANQIMYF